jgi:hypothetical protein
MAIYRVYIPVGGGDPVSTVERVRFLREGFSWPAFLFGPIWLLARGLWRPFVVWCLGAIIVAFAVSFGRLPNSAGIWLYLLSAAFLGIEGQNLAAAAMERNGFGFADIVTGDAVAAQRGFFSRWLADAPTAPQAARPNVPIAPAHVIGLFPEAGG